MFKLNSIERRFERYKILSVWKILEGKTPNCSIAWETRLNTGRMCIIPASKGRWSKYRDLRSSSFQTKAPALFNCLPPDLRNLSGCTTDTFKFNLDKYLSSFPDCPVVPGGDLPAPVDQFTVKLSNSIRDWTRFLKLNVRRQAL